MSEKPPEHYNEGNVSQMADVAKTGLKGLSPADTGWILAVVIIICAIQVADYFGAVRLSEYLQSHMESQTTLITKYMEVTSEQQRRAQETIKALTDASIRDGERAGRAAVQAITEGARANTERLQHDIFEEEGQDGSE